MAGFLMSNEEYRCRDGISKSTLQHMDKSPQHYLYNIEHPRTDTSAFAFGRACHKYILEKDAFEEEFAVAPYCDRRTKDGKAIYSNFVASSSGKEIITREDMEQIIEMSNAIDRVPLARALPYKITVFYKGDIMHSSAKSWVCDLLSSRRERSALRGCADPAPAAGQRPGEAGGGPASPAGGDQIGRAHV